MPRIAISIVQAALLFLLLSVMLLFDVATAVAIVDHRLFFQNHFHISRKDFHFWQKPDVIDIIICVE